MYVIYIVFDNNYVYLLCVYYDFLRFFWKRSKRIFFFKAFYVRMLELFF